MPVPVDQTYSCCLRVCPTEVVHDLELTFASAVVDGMGGGWKATFPYPAWDFSGISPSLGFGIVDFFSFFAVFKNKGARSFCLWARSDITQKSKPRAAFYNKNNSKTVKWNQRTLPSETLDEQTQQGAANATGGSQHKRRPSRQNKLITKPKLQF